MVNGDEADESPETFNVTPSRRSSGIFVAASVALAVPLAISLALATSAIAVIVAVLVSRTAPVSPFAVSLARTRLPLIVPAAIGASIRFADATATLVGTASPRVRQTGAAKIIDVDLGVR
jgi:hypothetical protein